MTKGLNVYKLKAWSARGAERFDFSNPQTLILDDGKRRWKKRHWR
jgi:hypothetical protein